MANHPPLISSAELAGKAFPPLRWPILGLLPEGLAVLVGIRGVGKSSLALSLAVAVSRGTPLFGTIPAKQGPCLVMSVEDTERRLQTRLSALLDDAPGTPPPENLHVCTELPAGQAQSLQLLTDWIQEHPRARLVVIDPLRRLVGRCKGPHAFVSRTEDLLDHLSKVAREYHLAILCTHHARIPAAADTLGAVPQRLRFVDRADTLLLLDRGRNETERLLSASGRDFRERHLVLIQNYLSGEWTEPEPNLYEEARESDTRRDILRLLKKKPSLTSRKIAETLAKNRNTVRSLVAEYVAAGILTRTEDGEYVAAEFLP